MIHKINDKFAIIVEKWTPKTKSSRAGVVVACISHPDPSKMKASSVAYLKSLKVLVSENLVSNIKVDQDSSFCMRITYDVSDLIKEGLSDAKDDMRNVIRVY